MSKTYVGIRSKDGHKFNVWVQGHVGGHLLPSKCDVLDLGAEPALNWCTERGAAQVAFALLCDVGNEAFALDNYDKFARECVQWFDSERWSLTLAEVLRWTSQRATCLHGVCAMPEGGAA